MKLTLISRGATLNHVQVSGISEADDHYYQISKVDSADAYSEPWHLEGLDEKTPADHVASTQAYHLLEDPLLREAPSCAGSLPLSTVDSIPHMASLSDTANDPEDRFFAYKACDAAEFRPHLRGWNNGPWYDAETATACEFPHDAGRSAIAYELDEDGRTKWQIPPADFTPHDALPIALEMPTLPAGAATEHYSNLFEHQPGEGWGEVDGHDTFDLC